MKTLATYNIKGGVGKTSTAVNLGYLAAQNNYKTLIWDLDPQGASTFYFRVKPKVKGGGENLINGKSELDGLIKATDYKGLDLLPADFSFRNLDLQLDTRKKPTKRIKKLLAPLQSEYDLIYLDCPPNISLLSESIFEASDILLSPIIPTTLSIRTLTQLKKYLDKNRLTELKLIPFFSMVDKRKTLHKEIMEKMYGIEANLLTTSIPYASDIERMGIERQPLGGFVNNSRSLEAYRNLWMELKKYLE